MPSTRTLLLILIVAVVAVGGFFAWQAYERDRNTLDISIGQDGIRVN